MKSRDQLAYALVVTASLLVGLAPSVAHAAQPRVAVLSPSSSGPDVQAAVKAAGGFTTVDLIDPSSTTPLLTDLKKYDVLIVYTSGISWADPVKMGDTISDFIDQGGGVVYFSYQASITGGSNNLKGKFAATKALMTPDSSPKTSSSTTAAKIGTRDEATSPILKNVKTFACSPTTTFNGPCHYLGTAPQHGAVITAHWDANAGSAPLVLHDPTNSLVEFNMFAADDSGASGLGEFDSTTDGDLMIANAVNFVAGGALRVDTGAIDFGDQPLQVSSAAHKITYTNTSPGPLTITAITVAGANAADFQVTPAGGLPITVAAGATFSAGVVFNPTNVGTRTGEVDAMVTGLPAPVRTTLTGNSIGPMILVTPSTLNLGGSMSGASLMDKITISNEGGGALNIKSITVDTDSASFTATPQLPPPFSLTPGATVDVAVVYKGADGAHNGSITITSNLPDVKVPLIASSGKPKIALGNGSLIFGTQHVGVNGPPQTLQVTNSGFSNLTVTGIATSGTNAMDFIVGAKLPLTILPGQSGTYTLTFKPSMMGGSTAIVSVASNDPATPSVTFNVAGNGVSFNEAVSPSAIDFGTVKGGMSAIKAVTITNMSAARLYVQSLMFSGAGAGASQFAIVGGPVLPSSIAGNGSLQLMVQYKPNTAGVATGQLTIGLDDPAMSTVNVTLKGTGTAGKLDVSPANIDFGAQGVGTTSMPKEIVFTNSGNDTVNVSTMSSGGTSSQDFVLTDAPMLPYALKAGMTLKVHVTFSPTASSAETGEIDIASDDPVMGMAKVTLTGMGVQAGINVSPMDIDFGIVPVSVTSTPQMIQIDNTGDADLKIDSVSSSDMQFQVPVSGFTVKKGASAMIMVSFAPRMAGKVTGSLSINPNDPNLSSVTVNLTGTGQSTHLGLSPMTLTWPVITVGKSGEPMPVTITNTSGSTLMLAPIMSSNPTIFAVDTTMTKSTLKPMEVTTFVVSFTPMAKGPIQASVSLSLVGAKTPIGAVMLSGEGIVGGASMGGCAVGDSHTTSSGALALFGLALAALMLRRRRS